MKRIFFITVLALFSFAFANAQKEPMKEGKVVYTLILPDTGEIGKVAGMIGKEQVAYFKDSSIRVESTTQMGNIVIITDARKGESHMLMAMMGEKYAIKMTDFDLNALKEGQGAAKPEVTITKETKKINGYKCTKAIVTTTVKGQKISSDYWFTNEISMPASATLQNSVEGIKGFLMEFTVNTQGFAMKMVCKSIEKMAVPNDKFVVPDDYTVKDMSEFMGGMK